MTLKKGQALIQVSDFHARTGRTEPVLLGDESQDMAHPQTRLGALEAREFYAGSEGTVRL